MSSTTIPAEVDHAQLAGTASRPSRRDLLIWSGMTAGLFLGAGVLRVLGSAVAGTDELTASCPFQLETVPKNLDGWKFIEGSETHLDQPTTRITGSTDHVIRTYYDELTGTPLSVLILYGPAEPVLPHTPQICYPASGYRTLGEPIDHDIVINDRLKAIFRAGLFAKSGGRSVMRQLVYHSYRLDGVWSPNLTERNLPRRHPGIFKVQIQRRVLDGERTDGDEPMDSFIRQLIPTLEQMIAAASRPGSSPPARAEPTSPVHR